MDSTIQPKIPAIELPTVKFPTGLAIISLIILGVYFLALWSFGFFTSSNVATTSSVVGIAGALVATIISIFGIVLKEVGDRQSRAQQAQTLALQAQTLVLQEENARHDQRTKDEAGKRAEDAEKRLNAEATTGAIGLLGLASGDDPSPNQRAGAILVLCDLERYALALPLIDTMLDSGKLGVSAACWSLNRALSMKLKYVPLQAAAITHRHVRAMLTKEGGALFPQIVFEEEFFILEVETRAEICMAVIDLILWRPYGEWDDDTFIVLFEALYRMESQDSDNSVRSNAGVALLKFVGAFESTRVLSLERKRIVVDVTAGEIKADLIKKYDKLAIQGKLVRSAKLRSKALADWR